MENTESVDYGHKAIEHTIHLSTGLSGPRKVGTEYEIEAANYIKGEFERIGYEVKVQEFSFDRKGETYSSQNVIAIKEGKSHEQIIVGAHYDQVDTEGSKGAHDNASGIAAILETAERLKDVETNYTIVFVAFGAEEVGLRGSAAYVDSMTEEEIEKTVAMVNLDSIIAGDYIYAYAGGNKVGWVRDQALAISEELGLDLITQEGLNPGYEWGITGDWSDHVAFYRKGIPIVYFESTNWLVKDEEGNYTDGYIETIEHDAIMHTGRDNLDFINEAFPGRVEDRFNTVIRVLEKLLIDIKPEGEITADNDKVSLSEAREIKVEVEFDQAPNLDELIWSFGNKPFDEWKKWDNEATDFVGEPWIKFVEGPTVEGNTVKATIGFDLPFDTENLERRPYPRWAYFDLLGEYDLRVTDGKFDSYSKKFIVNAYDDFHLYDEIKPALDEIMNLAKDKKDRYFEYSTIGKSVEGRDLHFMVIAKDKETIDNYLNNTKQIALNNPKELIEKIANGKLDYQVPIFINNVHPDESPGIDAQLKVLKLFATEDEITFNKNEEEKVTLSVKDILDNVILVFNLTQNPDGRYHNTRHNINGFDLNRDNGYQIQQETKAVVNAIAKWTPIAFLDLHGFVPEFLIEPCTPPHDPNFEYDLIMGGPRDPETGDVGGKPGAIEHARAMGSSGIANTRYEGFIIPLFDYGYGWDDGTLAYTGVYAIIHGAMGHTIEIPELNQHSVDAAAHAILGSINYVMNNKDALYTNQLNVFLRGINNEDNRAVDTWHIDEEGNVIGRPRGDNENFFPEYYILPVDKSLQKNPLQVYNMVELLLNNGVKVERLVEDVEFDGVTYPEGSFIVPLRQAKRGMANAVLWQGSDESKWDGMYAELVINFPAMRGFDIVEVRKEGIFDDSTEEVTEVVIPSTEIDVSADKYVIRNTNNDAIKAVNSLLRAGKAVYIVTQDGADYEKGDFVVPALNFKEVKDNYLLDVVAFENDVAMEKLISPKIKITDSGSKYASTTDHTRFVLEELGFEIVNDDSADIIVDASGRADIEEIKAGKSYIGIGRAAAKLIEDSGIMPGLKTLTTDYSHEGLLNGVYSQESIITAPYDEHDYLYTSSGTVITEVPETSIILAKVSDEDDFYIAGWWPGHEAIKGQIFAIKDKAGQSNITLFAGDITNKAHPQHLFRLLANSLYESLLD